MTEAHRYSVDNFMAQLPAVLFEDRRMNALARAIAEALGVHLDEIPLTEIYTRIDELPEDVLDILARDYKIDWYDFDYPIEAKRNLVKTSYYVHRHLGTTGAVKEAIRSLYPRSDIEEWFDYGGDPYSFRVALESGFPIIPISNTEILKAVYTYKSLRSHLEAIVYRATINVGIKISSGWVAYWGRIAGTYPERAVQGEILSSELAVNTSTTDGLAYTTRLCGTAPGGIL